MKNIEEMGNGDFQKLLQIALQSLEMKQTIVEGRITELNQELRTLERDEEIEKLEAFFLSLKKDYQHYLTFVDEKKPYELDQDFL